MVDKNTHLSAEHARSMAKITQSPLQLQGVSSRWLLKVLPWVDVDSGVYQVNRTVYNEDEREVIQVATSYKHDENPTSLPKTASLPEIPPTPRHYDLSVVQTILELQSRAVDLYSEPHNVTSTQVQLTVEGLREKQEHEMINNPNFGLLHVADSDQRIKSVTGRFTPDALDDLLSRRRKTQFIFAHPKAIVAFGRECNQQGLNIENIPFGDNLVPSWRGVPLLSCNKIPVNQGKTSIIAMRTGEDCGGIVGLRPKILPDQSEPGVNIRFMGINDQAMISYLVSNYFSVAVLLPNALGILDNIDVE
jgi:hypothetical protein